MGGFHFGSHPASPVSIRVSQSRPAHPLAQVSPSWKLFVMLVLVLCTAVMPISWYYWHLALVVFLGVLILAGRIPLRAFFLRLALLAPFVLGVSLASVIHRGSGPVWWAVALRGGLCVATVTAFASVTPLGALPGLLRRLRVPSLLVTTLALMHRYLHVLVDESERMHRARASRTLRKGKAFTWALSADLVGRLFVRASERAERIYLAMCARGWK